ncbi:IS30 family transposase [Clostridia bacterium]|nr:IS30 family transposase [Clostridia bacterium]
MEYPHNTPSTRKNKHLSSYERGQIKLLSDQGQTPYAIGKILGRASNTIRNELERGTVCQIKQKKTIMVYLPDAGQMAYERNRKFCCPRFKMLECSEFIDHAIHLVRDNKYSLDAIVGAARLHGLFDKTEMVCTKTLYNYVDQGLLSIRNIDLPLKVKRSSKNARNRKHKKVFGASISDRPEQANDRSEFGHWEIDTVIGKKTKGEAVLLTITERKTRKEIIRKIASKSSDAVLTAVNQLAEEAGPLFTQAFKSITADNGSEFSELALLEKNVGSNIYFAHPYTSCERGTNEVHNGLIRRFIPKGRSMNNYSHSSIERVQTWCNSLPRKILGYQTPDEAFAAEVQCLIAS